MTNLYKEIIINFFSKAWKWPYILDELHQLFESHMWGFKSLNNIKYMIIMGWSSFNNAKDYKKQKVLHHMGDTCKWNKCLDRSLCLHRTTMGTNRKVVHICMHLFHFSPFAFTFFMPNHWCKNCLGHNKGYLWNYLPYLLQIIMGRNFD
jgi:hypothetical protein